MEPTLERGEELFASGKLDKARDCFQALVTSDPQNARAWNDLGVVRLVAGDGRTAEEAFRKALEVDPDLMEARLNLIGWLEDAGRWGEAAVLLEPCVDRAPGEIGWINRLARAYARSGQKEKSQSLLDNSPAVGVMKTFIDSLWSNIYYWELTDGPGLRDRLEGVVAGALAAIDGMAGDGPLFKLVAEDSDSDGMVVLEGLRDLFYYKNNESPAVEMRRTGRTPVLSPDHLDDWTLFIELLYRDIHAEGMCLGDFTHSKRALKADPRLAGYDMEATFQFFRDNLGPCDCHVFRYSEMGLTSVKEKVDREAAACPWRPQGAETPPPPATR